MEETKKNDVQKKNWFAGLKSEFQKIVWLDKKSLGKQTVAVLVVSVRLLQYWILAFSMALISL